MRTAFRVPFAVKLWGSWDFSERRFQAGVGVVPQGFCLRFARVDFFWKGLDKEGISLYNKRCYGESVDLETPKRWRLPPPIPEDAKISFLPSDNSEGR